MNAASLQESTSDAVAAQNARRYERFAVNLRATMVLGKKTVDGGVVDISFNGLFFATSEPPSLRNLTKINVELPTGKTIPLLGMAVHAVQPAPSSKRRPGVGVQLFGVAPDIRALWDAYVTSVRDTYAAAKKNGTAPNADIVGLVEGPKLVSSAGQATAPVGPPLDVPSLTSQDVLDAFSRIELPSEPSPATKEAPPPGPGDIAPGPRAAKAKPELRIRVRSEKDVAVLRGRRERGESLFFRTEVHMEPGTPVVVRVLLPSGDTSFVADGKVVSRATSSKTRGLNVVLDMHDGTFEEIYITIDLETSLA
ncbi:MAG: PilZ domain-containing protein [Myxococcota bacterium]